MKSFLFIFILSLLSISNILSKEEGCSKVATPNKDNCNAGISAEDKNNYEKCCYLKFTYPPGAKETNKCELLTKYQFEHLKDVIKNDQYHYSGTYTIECKANYIKFGLLSLVLLFI